MLIFLIVCQIPIYKGCDVSLVEPVVNEEPYHGQDGFGNSTHDEEPDLKHLQAEHGVNALVRIVKQNPGEKLFILMLAIILNELGSILKILTSCKELQNYSDECQDS